MNQPYSYLLPSSYDGWQEPDPTGLPGKLPPTHPVFQREDAYAPGWWTDGRGQRRRLEDLASEHLICIAGMLWRHGVCERFGIPHYPSSVTDTKDKLREVLRVLETRAEAVYCEGHAKEAQLEPPSHEETLRLVLDLTVALEGLRFPDLRDSRVDPEEVNARALKWVEENAK